MWSHVITRKSAAVSGDSIQPSLSTDYGGFEVGTGRNTDLPIVACDPAGDVGVSALSVLVEVNSSPVEGGGMED